MTAVAVSRNGFVPEIGGFVSDDLEAVALRSPSFRFTCGRSDRPPQSLTRSAGRSHAISCTSHAATHRAAVTLIITAAAAERTEHILLILVRLAHDWRLVSAGVIFVFVFVVVVFLFIFIGISGRHRVAHDNEGTGGNRPDRKFLENVLLHVCSSKMPLAECEGLIVIEMMSELNRLPGSGVQLFERSLEPEGA